MPAENLCCAVAELATDNLRDVPLDNLCAEAKAQEHNFVSGLPSNDAAGVELFRRAIADSDELAWAAVIDLYRGLLLSQSSRQVVRGFIAEDDRFVVDRAFQRFWQATRVGGMHQFTGLASILKYLKMCLASVLLDEARARRRQPITSIDDVSPDARVSDDPASLVVSRIARRELWHAIDQELRDDQERTVAQMSFVLGLTPREILTRRPEHFDDIAHIYRVKRNVIDRVRRSPAIRQLLD
jgi:DNA-directed RNA polymerase specialized sigma24 family protein